MKKETIIYSEHGLCLSFMVNSLREHGFHNQYEILKTSSLGEIRDLVTDNSQILLLYLNSMNMHEALDVVEKVLAINSDLKIIVISVKSEMKMVKRFFDRGVKGYLGKDTDYEEFHKALAQIIDGNVYISNDSKEALVNFICSVDDEKEKTGPRNSELTAREMDVLNLICDGLRTKAIAEKLFISTHTVESHRRNILLKFNINSSSQLVKYALENSLVN